MAYTTDDINLGSTEGWVAVILTGTELHITEVLGNDIMCRFDIASNSAGFVREPGQTLSCEETIYVKARYFNRKASIIVVRD